MSKLLELTNGTAGTHGGKWHSDDIAAIAALEMAGVIVSTARTRDPDMLAKCDIRVDVGGRYDPDTFDFDHHQEGGAGKRANGHPYSSFGLIWKEVGAYLCKSEAVAAIVDTMFVQPIDIRDCGSMKIPKAGVNNTTYSLGDIITMHYPPPSERTPELVGRRFRECVEMMRLWLWDAIEAARFEVESEKYVREMLDCRQDKRILVLGHYVSWLETVKRHGKDVKIVIFESDDSTGWKVKPWNGTQFPLTWAGKQGTEFQQLTRVQGSLFCSDTRHIVGAATMSAAIAIAQNVLQPEVSPA